MNRTIVNVACSILVLAANIIINLVLSPIIVETLGVEANGFVTLANNCVTYAQLLTAALNSMAARFITIELTRGDTEKANLYYNSVFWGNLVLVLILLVPATVCVVKLELIFDVPSDILWDVKVLFAFVFANFLLTTGMPKWECGPFAVNRLDRSYIPQTIGMIARCVVVFSMFALLVPHIWYVGLAASVMTAITLIANAYNTHMLTPELRIGIRKGKRRFSVSAVKDLMVSGIWNSIQSVGTMLLNGMDILIANMLLGANPMGIVSLSKTLPLLMQQLSGSICNALAPELTIDWANRDRSKLLRGIDRAMTMTSCVMTVPLVGIMVFGDRFYELWVPDQDAQLLWVLSVLGMFGYTFTSGTQILYNVFATVNKVRPNAVAVLMSGVISIVATALCVIYTPLGIFAVGGVSNVVNLVRNMAYTLPATAKYLGCKWTQFYPQVLKSLMAVAMLLVIGFAIKTVIPGGSWGLFVLAAVVFAVIGFVMNSFMLLSGDDRRVLIAKISGKLKGIRG